MKTDLFEIETVVVVISLIRGLYGSPLSPFTLSSVVNRCSFHGDMVSPSVGSVVTIAVNKRCDWLRVTENGGAVPVGRGRLGEGVNIIIV